MAMSLLKQSQIQGPLTGNAKRNTSSKVRNYIFTLNLTSLIDAFSILVIFLLTNFNSDAQNLNVKAGVKLPEVSQTQLLTLGTLIKIEDGQYFLDEVPVASKDLVKALIEKRKNNKNLPKEAQSSLIIQADKKLNFEDLSPIISAGGMAGFDEYKFAVLPKLNLSSR